MSSSSSRIVTAFSEGLEPIGPAVCAIGAFDGVHIGHRYLIDSMVSDARARGVKSVVVSFDIDPDELFRKPTDVHKILMNEDRIRLLADCGADFVYIIPFTHELAALSAEEFLEDVVGAFCDLSAIHVGSDFRLGAGNGGSVETMRAWGALHGCSVEGYELMREAGNVVTATRIRELLAKGDVSCASELLGRDHFMKGIVRPGRGEGASLGFRTANVDYDKLYTPVKDGVYAGHVLAQGALYPAAINVGVPPTFENAVCALEPHLIGFTGDLYDCEVEVRFVTRLRDTVAFESIEELKATVNSNIEWVRTHLS